MERMMQLSVAIRMRLKNKKFVWNEKFNHVGFTIFII